MKKFWIIIGIVTVISIALQMLSKHYYWWEDIPAFYALFGIAGCVLLTYFAKSLIGLIVMKKEDYYDAR